MQAKPLAQRHPDETVGVVDLAAHWDKPVSSILSDRTRAPWRVPPICSPEGVRPLRWRVGTVLAFDRTAEEKALAAVIAAPPTVPTRRRRGRPTKAEQLAVRRAAEVTK